MLVPSLVGASEPSFLQTRKLVRAMEHVLEKSFVPV